MRSKREANTARTFMRSRHWRILLLIAVLLIVGEALLPMGSVGVPMITDRSTTPIYLFPLFATAAWTICVPPPSPDLERMLPQHIMRLRRTCWYLGATAVLTSVGTVSLGLRVGDPFAGSTVGRAVLFGMAIATLSAMVVSTRIAWIAPFLGTVTLWFYGTTNQEATPQWWALPLYPTESGLAAIAAWTCWFVAGVLYVARDGRAAAD